MKRISEPVETLEIELVVNGEPARLTVATRRLLADLLREDLGLTGTHVGCDEGGCGACTVLMDGAPVRSCLMLAVQAEGAQVTTVEGITPPDGLNATQQAFKRRHALQCGFCTPGVLMTLAGSDPAEYPDELAIRELLGGNLCRCTGYEHIVDAVREVWKTR